MKKIIALLLSALMIFSVAAVAEGATDTALVTRVSNIAFELTEGSETLSRNLEGFEAFISLDTADGLALVAQAFNGDDSLALAVAKLVDTQLHLAIDGVDKVFAADVPQLQGQDTAALGEMLRPILPALLNFRLPKIEVPSLPELDLVSVVGMLGTDNGDGTIGFSVPHEMIDGLLDQLLEVVKASDSGVPGMDQGIALVEQLRASGMSVALEGQVADEGDRQTLSVSVYPVSNGQTADAPVAIVNFASARDEITLTVDMPSGDAFMTAADLDVTTDAAENSFAAALDIAGLMHFDAVAFREDGRQKAALLMNSGFVGSGFDVTLTYDEKLTELNFNVDDEFAILVSTTIEAVSDSAVAGQFELTAEGVHVTADVEEFLGDLELGDFTMPEEIVPIDQLSSGTHSEALQAALMPVIGYFSQVFMEDAA